MIYLKGSLVEVEAKDIMKYRGIDISFKERNCNLHGTMELSFSCAVFNCSGFYTRSLALPEDEM